LRRDSLSKEVTQKFDMDSSNFKKLKNFEIKEQYLVKSRNRFAPIGNFDDDVGISRA
jgi:hypothetical protein